MNIDAVVQKVSRTVQTHRLSEGAYSRYLWQDEKNSRKMGVNEYGCADAANILYTIGQFEGDPDKRACWVKTMQAMQNPETGLFYEGTHHTIHTTAHVVAALELFDAQPLYPLTALFPYRDRDALYDFLENLNWAGKPWPQSHQGAGLFAALTITRSVDAQWQRWYFDWLRERCDPVTGISYGQRLGQDTLAHHLYGWFHYMFNHEYARRPMPYPDKMIDSCIDMYDQAVLDPLFGRRCGFCEIDWVFCLNRATRQTPHRFFEAKDRLRDFSKTFVTYLTEVDEHTTDDFNDLHSLFGAMCALAELQQALPGELESTVPLKLVLDRRPFI
ncbi:MAG: hypothetical protein IJ048_06315 [Clostridia bacterium]|nr:hypothetical protein [Clostridia bacterium]